MGEVGQEGLTRSLCTFAKPAHLGGFNFTADTTRYLSQGDKPVTRIFTRKDGEFVGSVLSEDTGLYAAALSDVLHAGRPSLVGVPKIGPERWALECFTARN